MPTRGQATTADDLNENDVLQLLVSKLKKQGWVILQALSVRQRGIDLIAKRASELLYAEAKGAVRVTNAAPLNVYGAMCSALMQTSAIRHLDDSATVVMALPDTEEYRYHVASLRQVLEATRIQAWLLDSEGNIRDGRRITEQEFRWPMKTLPLLGRSAPS